MRPIIYKTHLFAHSLN